MAVGRSCSVAALVSLVLACGSEHPSTPRAGEPPGASSDAPGVPGSGAPASPARPAVPRIAVLFKLDPRLHGGTYGGEVWVSPPTYRGAHGQDAVDIRAHHLDAIGQSTVIEPSWSTSDANLLAVEPVQGAATKITVRRAGAGTVTATWGGLSKVLHVTAEANAQGRVVQLAIAQ
jgi:hypothetical protein